MKVSWDNLRTLEEEYEKLQQDLADNGRFFAWEVHPNKVRVSDIRAKRIFIKMEQVMSQMIDEGIY